MKALQLRVRQDRRNQQDRIRAPFDGFENLPLVDDEILAQQRELRRRANLPEMVERSEEELLVREHRQTTRARRLVIRRDARGAAAFRLAQRRQEIAALTAFEQRVAQIPGSNEALRKLSNFALLLLDDSLKDVCHRDTENTEFKERTV